MATIARMLLRHREYRAHHDMLLEHIRLAASTTGGAGKLLQGLPHLHTSTSS